MTSRLRMFRPSGFLQARLSMTFAFTEERGTDSDHRCAFLNRHLEVVTHPHRELSETALCGAIAIQALEHFAQSSEIRPRSFGRFEERRQSHETGKFRSEERRVGKEWRSAE